MLLFSTKRKNITDGLSLVLNLAVILPNEVINSINS